MQRPRHHFCPRPLALIAINEITLLFRFCLRLNVPLRYAGIISKALRNSRRTVTTLSLEYRYAAAREKLVGTLNGEENEGSWLERQSASSWSLCRRIVVCKISCSNGQKSTDLLADEIVTEWKWRSVVAQLCSLVNANRKEVFRNTLCHGLRFDG